jgi:hypothetical protein
MTRRSLRQARTGRYVPYDRPSGKMIDERVPESPGGATLRPLVHIRLSLLFYAEDCEFEETREAVDETCSTDAWRRWIGRPSRVV